MEAFKVLRHLCREENFIIDGVGVGPSAASETICLGRFLLNTHDSRVMDSSHMYLGNHCY